MYLYENKSKYIHSISFYTTLRLCHDLPSLKFDLEVKILLFETLNLDGELNILRLETLRLVEKYIVCGKETRMKLFNCFPFIH